MRLSELVEMDPVEEFLVFLYNEKILFDMVFVNRFKALFTFLLLIRTLNF